MDAPYVQWKRGAKIALVGEAAGEDEIRSRQPFVGRAGQHLNKLLASAGINRADCHIDNVFQFHPAGNDIKPYLDLESRKKNRTDTEIFLQSKAALKERLQQVCPNIVVALGRTALYALTGKTAITSYRGSLLLSTEIPGLKILPAIHPSAALRTWLDSYLIIRDLQRAKQHSESPALQLLERRLILEPSFVEAQAFLREALDSKTPVAFDIEVQSEEVSHLSLALSPSLAICIPFVERWTNYWSAEQEAEIWTLIARLLEDPAIPKVGQNLVFDTSFLFQRLGIVTRNIEDTMVAQALIDPDFPKGLDFLTSIYCNGEPYYKADGKRWFKNPFGSDLIFRRYSAMDSAVVSEIWPQQEEQLKKDGNLAPYRRQMALIDPLVFMSVNGIPIDVEGLRAAGVACEANTEELQKELNAMCGAPLNVNSPPAVATYFYIKKKLKPHTKKGAITTDDKALKMIALKGHREASLILDIRHLRKMKGTYFDMVVDADNRLRCSFNPVGTKQGRISSSSTIFDTGGNLQNQPKEMQALMHADPGQIVISMDLAQAENRVVAYEAGELRMIEAFENGIDIHTQTAALIYKVAIEDVTKELRAGGKRANHGLNYDLGAKTFALYYQIPQHEADFVVNTYHMVYPGVRRWHGAIKEQLAHDRTLTNPLGRKRTFLGFWGPELWKEAYSYIPQSAVADVLNYYGVVFVYQRQDLFPEVTLLNQVHDSLKFQMPLSCGALRIVSVIRTIMENLEVPLTIRGRSFSIPADTKLGLTMDENSALEWKAKKMHTTDDGVLAEELERYVSKACS